MKKSARITFAGIFLLPICVQESPKGCFSTAWGLGDMRPPHPLRRYAAQSGAAAAPRVTRGNRRMRLRVGPKPWGVRGNHSPALFGLLKVQSLVKLTDWRRIIGSRN